MMSTMSTMSPLASTVLMIRKCATASFQAGFELLAKDEQVKIINDLMLLSGSDVSVKKTYQSSDLILSD